MSNDLINAFLLRAKKYKEHTSKVLDTIQHVTTGLVQYLNIDPDTMKWEDVEVDQEYVMLKARHIKVKDGEVQIYTIGIPLTLAESGTSEDVVAYLTEHDDRNADQYDGEDMADDSFFDDDPEVVSHSSVKRVLH